MLSHLSVKMPRRILPKNLAARMNRQKRGSRISLLKAVAEIQMTVRRTFRVVTRRQDH
jgi:hypothetical protein